MKLLFLLLAGHALGDFGLQSEWIAKNKIRKASPYWFHVLTAHALIQGLTVYLATYSVMLAIMETVAHWIIDFGKGEDFYGFHVDQFLHIGFRAIWFLVAIKL